MKFSISQNKPESQKTDCIVVMVMESRQLSATAQILDNKTNAYLSKLLKSGDLEGKLGQSLLVHQLENSSFSRILLVGCGKKEDLGLTQFKQIVTKTITCLVDTGVKKALFCLNDLAVKDHDLQQLLHHFVVISEQNQYKFEQLKSKAKTHTHALKEINLVIDNTADKKLSIQTLVQAKSISSGMSLAKDLANLPGNICTPSYLAEQAKQIAKSNKKITCEVLNEKQMTQLNMNALLSVSKGSHEQAKLIVLNYQAGSAKSKPIVLVGKGVTFDSGGISLKPGAGMDEMKYDMCGAASVIGTMKAIAEMGLAINVIGVIPATENLPDGLASKPGDIVTSMSGQTIEILNTDAEGRLILCDALTYSERFEPKYVIDVATLTGACIIALGHHSSALFSNNDKLAKALTSAGVQSNDRVWELPIWEEYHEQLKSNFADIANIGGRSAGSITAACFLAKFAKKFHWAHLDIAGTAWDSGANKGATGKPVALLSQFLINQSKLS